MSDAVICAKNCARIWQFTDEKICTPTHRHFHAARIFPAVALFLRENRCAISRNKIGNFFVSVTFC